MYGNSIVLTFIPFLVLINGQYDTQKDSLQDIDPPFRISKSAFDAQFYRGRCPGRFYQIGQECLYFGTDGRKYSWQQSERACGITVGRLLERQASYIIGQVNFKPKHGVRLLRLNTPEKVKILEAFYREYEELNFAVRLPSNYDKLNRCQDSQDDNWPHYCINPQGPNATCFETNAIGSNDICIRQINCDIRYLRLACEFTLPGSPELTAPTFRQCPKEPRLYQQLSVWAWLLVAVGGMLLLLLILGGVLTLIHSSQRVSTHIRKAGPAPLHTDHEASKMTSGRNDSAREPMLVRSRPATLSEPDYLEPQPLRPVI